MRLLVATREVEAQLRHTSKAAAEEFCLQLDLGLDAASGVSTAAGLNCRLP